MALLSYALKGMKALKPSAFSRAPLLSYILYGANTETIKTKQEQQRENARQKTNNCGFPKLTCLG
jgi:hypothetical protein